ncbi:MAG: tRNA lysidine(34) synthetase TilS [Ruminococcaceae bacterium]|nr:tRNA lysidine(34) synthetase TilS [Oscillospiraceae bacterium]
MRKIDKFENKLLKTIKKYNMLNAKDRVLVGLSGGKDSVALLYSLSRISDILDVELVAFHMNHMIRGEEAIKDETFSKNFANSLNVKFFSVNIDVLKEAETSDLGVEAVARNIRYSQFEKIAKENGCNKIATAHTASDNSENVLMTLTRHGKINGIPPVRDSIIRPLILHSTQEVLDYCESHSLEYVTDSTNSDENYTRNFFRNKVISEISKINPSFDESCIKISEISRSNDALVQLEVKRYLEEHTEPFSTDALKTIVDSVSHYNVIYNLFSLKLREFDSELSYSQFDTVLNIIRQGSVGDTVTLSNDVVIRRTYDEIEITKSNITPEDFSFEVKIGANPIPHSNIILYLEKESDYFERCSKNELKSSKVNKLTKNILIKYNIINSTLIARSRLNGDSYVCRGISRSVKKFFVDEKIPSSLRSRIPIVCDNDGIVWVAGLGIADRFRDVKEDKGETYSLSIEFTI